MDRKLDMLAFGAHPDDVEIGMAGTIAKHVHKGNQIGICDLTLAELSSNGNVEIRQKEATIASEIMGIADRMNLLLPDRGLNFTKEKIDKIVEVIRTTKPKYIFLPYKIDRHPDHAQCTNLVEEAIFSAGIKNYLPALPAHKVSEVFYYMINGFHKPQITVDITEYIEKKINTLKAYESQFMVQSGSVRTPLTEDYIDSVISRERLIGKEVGVKYAEGFFLKRPYNVNYF